MTPPSRLSPGAPDPTTGLGGQTDRGSIATQGAIWLSQDWKFGWDVMRLSDKWYLNDYGVPNQVLVPTLPGNFFSETASTVYLNGQGDRGYFDLRGYSFQGLANFDYQPQLAAVWPMLDYNKTIDIAPEKTYGVGGQIEVDANLTSSSAALASFQQANAIEVDNRLRPPSGLQQTGHRPPRLHPRRLYPCAASAAATPPAPCKCPGNAN